jgi:predicted ribosome quality control (RQC) complex YloA/Tae2 family protein
MNVQHVFDKRELYFLKYGRHFRLDSKTKVIAGRSKKDNTLLLNSFDKNKDVLLKHVKLPGPDVILTGNNATKNIRTAAIICASYTKSKPGDTADIRVLEKGTETVIRVTAVDTLEFKHLMI